MNFFYWVCEVMSGIYYIENNMITLPFYVLDVL